MITQINDFIFCPRSIYFHDVYRGTADPDVYIGRPQIIGRKAHKTVDEGSYSTRKRVVTGLMVYSAQYGLLGRIDQLDTASGQLTERKYSVTAVYDGYRYQLYAQYFALKEMGYAVRLMRIHSIKNNQNYPVSLPSESDVVAFETVLDRIRAFTLEEPFVPNPNKCSHCIYVAAGAKGPRIAGEGAPFFTPRPSCGSFCPR